jgi:hypothetical protein
MIPGVPCPGPLLASQPQLLLWRFFVPDGGPSSNMHSYQFLTLFHHPGRLGLVIS